MLVPRGNRASCRAQQPATHSQGAVCPQPSPPPALCSLAEVVVHLLVEVLAQEVAPEAEECVHLLALPRAALRTLLQAWEAMEAGWVRCGGALGCSPARVAQKQQQLRCA